MSFKNLEEVAEIAKWLMENQSDFMFYGLLSLLMCPGNFQSKGNFERY